MAATSYSFVYIKGAKDKSSSMMRGGARKGFHENVI